MFCFAVHRFVFHTAFDALQSQANTATSGVSVAPIPAAGAATTGAVQVTVGGNIPEVNLQLSEKLMKTQWLLWEEFYCIENAFGSSDIIRLNRIRDNRNLARGTYLEKFSSETNSMRNITASTLLGGNIRYMGYTI